MSGSVSLCFLHIVWLPSPVHSHYFGNLKKQTNKTTNKLTSYPPANHLVHEVGMTSPLTDNDLSVENLVFVRSRVPKLTRVS